MLEALWTVVAATMVLWLAVKMLRIKRVIVYEYQKALRYRKGQYIGTLDPGQYWIFSRSSSIVPIDVRPEFITIQGQDVLTAPTESL